MPRGEGASGPAPCGEPDPLEPVTTPQPPQLPERHETIEYAVLCGPEDHSAIRIAGALRSEGLAVRVVTSQEIVYSTSLRHTVAPDGRTSAAVRLADGSLLGPGLKGTLNRMTWIPTDHLKGAAPSDREYALQELQAVLVSLVHGLPGVVLGRPDGRGLCGARWGTAEWMARAGRAGLTVPGYRTGAGGDRAGAGRVPGIPMVVVGDEVVVPDGVSVPGDVEAGVRRLARDHGSGLLGVELREDGRADPKAWPVVDVSPVPDLLALGRPLVSALGAALLGRERVAA